MKKKNSSSGAARIRSGNAGSGGVFRKTMASSGEKLLKGRGMGEDGKNGIKNFFSKKKKKSITALSSRRPSACERQNMGKPWRHMSCGGGDASAARSNVVV